ncbi:MAG: hypothetical protein L0G87_03955 [Renibacterium salmoninarum]|nr:hypothetical protein [Renibacterium salmoninarum]
MNYLNNDKIGMSNNMWDSGYGWLYYLSPVLWIVLIGGVVWLIIFLVTRSRNANQTAKSAPATPGFSPEQTLAQRYAAGEINEEEFHYRSQFLRSNGVGQNRM